VVVDGDVQILVGPSNSSCVKINLGLVVQHEFLFC
jgi:hypothetical protein